MRICAVVLTTPYINPNPTNQIRALKRTGTVAVGCVVDTTAKNDFDARFRAKPPKRPSIFPVVRLFMHACMPMQPRKG